MGSADIEYKIRKLQNEIKELERQRDKYENMNGNINKALPNMRKAEGFLKQMSSELEQNYDSNTAKKEVSSLENENDKIEKIIETLENTLIESNNQIKQIKNNISRKREQIRELKRALSNADD